ncbi:MAG: hypothetical protein V1834_04030 [Candidatus Micrarchaeota archaeon]
MASSLKVLKEEENRLTLHASGWDSSLLNALRRTVISDLPAFAIDEVDFYENSSVLFNDYLAHRIGLIPLSFEEGLKDDATVSFALDAEAIDEDRFVYSKELTSTDDKIKVQFPNIPIAKLVKGQKLRLEATAVIGTGKKHAKFQSALASFGSAEDYKERKDDALKPQLKQGDFVFFVESFNNLSARQQLNRALETVESELTVLEKELK